MNIIKMKTNHIINPLGFDLGKPKLSFIVAETEGIKQQAAAIEVALDKEFNEIVYSSGKNTEIDSLGFELQIKLMPCTRYFWRVTVWVDNGEYKVSDTAWFETGKLDMNWEGIWISSEEMEESIHPVINKNFILNKKVKSARAYICGLGLYELEINNTKAGNEYLSPSCNAYDKWLQYQTYDITESLMLGENNINVILGNGWYKGRFGFDGGKENIYGNKLALICDIVIYFEDGSKITIPSDTSWTALESKVKFSGIYDGEIYDNTFESQKKYAVKEVEISLGRLRERLSLPVIVKEEIRPIEVIITPLGETVLDMGQNMTGWLKFKAKAPKGAEILLQYGEVLQDGNFYRENLRSAKAEYKYISDGKEVWVRPHFTYYGFRYVKISGWNKEINLDDFIGCVLYSDMETTGYIETSNLLVNKLFLNAMWGQKGNFLDVPTDCPQRDERMGWTGDAQVFSGTASFNMDSYAFFSKYCYDLAMEQEKHDGMVPMVVPAIGGFDGTSSAWGDAATIIPWNMYLFYGDKKILENQFNSMKSWVDYIRKADDKNGRTRLWQSGFHFGDWLALDGENPNAPSGGTEETFIASAYYYYSVDIVSKTSEILGFHELALEYSKLAKEIRESIRNEYITNNGRLALENQTAYIVALFMELVPEEHIARVAKDLNQRIKNDKESLKTGFVGTPYICRVLSEHGYNEMAYKLLLNKDYPSWLYPVTMGATTIWERWNSILPDGKISGTDMNSLNHYAYGSIAEWMYRNMAGINPVEDKPGFRHVKLAPMVDYRFKFIKAEFNSPVGLYKSAWEIKDDGRLNFNFTVPFNASASLILPHLNIESLYVNGVLFKDSQLNISEGNIELYSGNWNLTYVPTVSYIKYYDMKMSVASLLENLEIKDIMSREIPAINSLSVGMIQNLGHLSIRELNNKPFFNTTEEEIGRVDEIISKIKISV